MPVLQTDTLVYTFQDVVEHLLDLHEIDRTPLNQRNARRAVLSAYRDFPNKHPWSYFYRQRLIQTAASYSTGTVAYDHTGGAHERLLTLTTGTWPTWAYYGRVIIDDVHYEVEDQKSDSLLTLREDSNPGADVTAGATYEIYRNAYPLPANFRRLGHLVDIEQRRALPVVEQQTQHDLATQCWETPSTPEIIAFRGTRDYLGALQLVFGPPPDEVRNYDLLYEANPRPLKIDAYTTGTITISGATVTGSSTTFPAECVGSILRVSNTPDAPTGVLGGLNDTDNRFASQHIIKARTSATSLVLEESTTTVSSAVGYSISDPIDIEAGAMLSAFLRMAEAEFCLAASRKDAITRKNLADMAIIEAIESDQRTKGPNFPQFYDYFRGEVTTL